MNLFPYFASGDLLDPKDGSLVWYPRGLLKEGYLLQQEPRRKIERRMWLAFGLALIGLVVPVAWLRLHLEVLAGPAGALALLMVAGVAFFLFFLDSMYWWPRRTAKALQKRDPNCRPKDVDNMQRQRWRPDEGLPWVFWLLIGGAILVGDFLKRAVADSLPL